MRIELPEIGVSNILDGFNNVYGLNGFASKLSKVELDKTRLYRYVKLEQFKENVKSNELVFVSPVLWEDKYERRFLFTDYSSLNFQQGKIRCMCITNEPYYGEEACWKSYSWKEVEFVCKDGKKECKIMRNKEMVRLTFNLGELLSTLDDFFKDSRAKIYIGETIYGLEVIEINNLHREGKKFHDVFFPKKFDVENYLSLMLIKRKAFSYENEIRIFIYYGEEAGKIEKSRNKKYNEEEKEKLLERIPVTYKNIVSEVRTSPFLTDVEHENQKNELSKYFSENSIVRSKLYSSGWELKSVSCDETKKKL